MNLLKFLDKGGIKWWVAAIVMAALVSWTLGAILLFFALATGRLNASLKLIPSAWSARSMCRKSSGNRALDEMDLKERASAREAYESKIQELNAEKEKFGVWKDGEEYRKDREELYRFKLDLSQAQE